MIGSQSLLLDAYYGERHRHGEAISSAFVESAVPRGQQADGQEAPVDAAAWLDLVEETGKTPEGLGASDHFPYVGRGRV